MIEKIYKAIRSFLMNNEYKLNNVFIFDWESDFFCMTKSGYSIEVEVKVSRSDFQADFKKPKHEYFKAAFNKQKYLMVDKSDATKNIVTGEYYLNNYNTCRFRFINPSEKTPNRFYYAVPKDLIKVNEVPNYAGLIYVSEYGILTVEKQAPLIHKTKVNLINKLLSKFYHRRNNALYMVNDTLHSVKNANSDNLMGIITFRLGEIKRILE